MTKAQLRKFINDTRGLIRGAPAEKKVKLLSLIKEAKRRCEETELAEMQIDKDKVEQVLGSKFATASLVGALSASGASHESLESTYPKQIGNQDYLEEK